MRAVEAIYILFKAKYKTFTCLAKLIKLYHIYQIEALTKGFLFHIVSHLGLFSLDATLGFRGTVPMNICVL